MVYFDTVLIRKDVRSMLEIREVRTKSELKKFVTYPNQLYRDVPQYMPPLISEDLADWNPKANPAYEYCECRCWLAWRDGKIVGRIGAILSRKANEKWNTRRMRFTQVDFIDDFEVSKALFDTVENWARKKGMNEVHGPLGCTDMDREGMLIEGFDQKGMFITYYNHPYYIDHMVRLGYVKDVDWVEFLIDIPGREDKITQRLEQMSQRIARMAKVHVVPIKSRLQYGPYIPKVFELVNTCYSQLYGTVDLSEAQIKKYAEKFIPMLDPRLVCFIENEENQLVGVGITAPSMAAAIKKHSGHMFPIGFIDILKSLRRNDTLDLFIIAVHPDYRNTGINAILMNHILKGCHQMGVTRAETGPQLEINEKVQHQWSLFQYRNHKKRRCWIKQLED